VVQTQTTQQRSAEALRLNQEGLQQLTKSQFREALEKFKQALAIHQAVGDKAGEGTTLNNIGLVYWNLGQYPKALEFYQQALAIRQEVGDKVMEGTTVNNIEVVYLNLGQYPKALEFYQQALVIRREVGDKTGEGTSLNNLGYLLNAQNQPELAIVFYKQSVNVTEAIRQDLRTLPKAQQVLDLLKLQELSDYIRNVRGNSQTQQGTEFLPQEQQLLAQYNAKLTQVVQLGKELEQLQKLPETDRTPVQETRRRQLETQQRQDKAEFLNFLRTPEIVALVKQLSNISGGENLNPKVLTQLQENLKQLKQDAVLLYPLIP
ncbi:MAG: tetratricopeptide repeat protein, partial [Coleofasciculaceae cyanobacterium]